MKNRFPRFSFWDLSTLRNQLNIYQVWIISVFGVKSICESEVALMRTETPACERQPRLYQGKKRKPKKPLRLEGVLERHLHWWVYFIHLCHFQKAWEISHHVPMGEHRTFWVPWKERARRRISGKLKGHSLRTAPESPVPDTQSCPHKPLAFVHSRLQSPRQMNAVSGTFIL